MGLITKIKRRVWQNKMFTPCLLFLFILFYVTVTTPFGITGVDHSAEVIKEPFTLDRSGVTYDGCQLSVGPTLQYPNVYGCKDNVFYTCMLGSYDCDPICTYFPYQVSSTCGEAQECVVDPSFKGCKDLPAPEPILEPEPELGPVELNFIESVLLSFNSLIGWVISLVWRS